MSSELLAEVDEAIKRERLEYIWKTYGNLIIGAVLVCVLGTGLYSAYSSWKKSREIQQTDIVIAASEINDPEKLLDASKQVDTGLSAIAKIKAAGALLTRHQDDKALAIYKEVAENKRAPKELVDLAKFMQAKLSIKISPDQSLTDFEAMSADATNPFRMHAHLESALIYAHIKQDFTSAGKHIDLILAETDIPQDLNAKANALRVLYTLKEKK